MSTYREADKEVEKLASGLLKYWYPDLAKVELSIEYLFAHAKRDDKSNEPVGPALKHNGWPACAVVKANSQKDRAAGLADVRIIVDGDGWEEWSKEKRLAVLHHELHHIELRYDENGGVLLDDSHRPKLKMRVHDFQIGGFVEIVKQHGIQAVEGQAVALAKRSLDQLEFNWDQAELVAAGSESMAAV